jgi:hypothetical protein
MKEKQDGRHYFQLRFPVQHTQGAGDAMMIIKETAYAKINLGLDVLGLRPDKYHEVAMVMQSVGLADTLTISENPTTGSDLR